MNLIKGFEPLINRLKFAHGCSESGSSGDLTAHRNPVWAARGAGSTNLEHFTLSARVTFSADQYAAAIVELASSAARAAPVIAASRLFAGTLAEWGAVSEGLFLSEQTLGPLGIFAPQLNG